MTRLSGRTLALGCVATLALSAGSAAANGFEDFGKTFHEKLQNKLHQELSGVVHASVQPLESQEFNWYYALSSGFNHNTWNELDKMVRPNDVGAMKLVDGTSFTDTYRNRVLASITFKLSNADQTRENKVNDDASAAATTTCPRPGPNDARPARHQPTRSRRRGVHHIAHHVPSHESPASSPVAA